MASGDMIEVFSIKRKDKTGTWSMPKIVLAINPEVGTVVVSAIGGKRSTVAFEDIRPASPSGSFAQVVQNCY